MSLTVELDITSCALLVVTVLAALLTGSSLQWVVDQGGLAVFRYFGCFGFCFQRCCGLSTDQLMELEDEESRALQVRQMQVQASNNQVHVKGIGRLDLGGGSRGSRGGGSRGGGGSVYSQRSYREQLFEGMQFSWQGIGAVLHDQNQQYYLIVAVAAITSLIQTVTCFVNSLMAPNLNFGFMMYIVINWVFMTHSSVMLVSKKLSCTYVKDSSKVWKRLLWINILMFPLSVFICVYWTVAWNFPGHPALEKIIKIMEPIQIALWGLIEFCLSGMFIARLWHYRWNVVERHGILVLLIVACCDISTVLLNLFIGDLESTCIKGFVYCLRIRLEISVLNAMVDSVRKKQHRSSLGTGVAAVGGTGHGSFGTGVGVAAATGSGSGDKMQPIPEQPLQNSISPFDLTDGVEEDIDDIEQGKQPKQLDAAQCCHHHCHQHGSDGELYSGASEEDPTSYSYSPKTSHRSRGSISSLTLTTDIEVMPTLYEDCCDLYHPSMVPTTTNSKVPDSAPKPPQRSRLPDSAPTPPQRPLYDTEHEDLHEHEYESANEVSHEQQLHEANCQRMTTLTALRVLEEELDGKGGDDDTATSSTDQMDVSAPQQNSTTFAIAIPPLPDVKPSIINKRASFDSKDSGDCDCTPSRPNRYDSEIDLDLEDEESQDSSCIGHSNRHNHHHCIHHQRSKSHESPKSVSTNLNSSTGWTSTPPLAVPSEPYLEKATRRGSLDLAPFKPLRFESGVQHDHDDDNHCTPPLEVPSEPYLGTDTRRGSLDLAPFKPLRFESAAHFDEDNSEGYDEEFTV